MSIAELGSGETCSSSNPLLEPAGRFGDTGVTRWQRQPGRCPVPLHHPGSVQFNAIITLPARRFQSLASPSLNSPRNEAIGATSGLIRTIKIGEPCLYLAPKLVLSALKQRCTIKLGFLDGGLWQSSNYPR